MCGGDIDSELDDANISRAYDEYRRRFGVIAPEDIRALRERYGLSQRAFGRLLGWGDVTIHRYETGALPDAAHNDLLITLQDPNTMQRYLYRHKDRLRALEWKRVEDVLKESSAILGIVRLRDLLMGMIEARSPAERGNRTFDLGRLGQMAVYFTAEDGVPLTKLLKLLFYSDFLAFKRRALSMSGAPYQRFAYGPVPERFRLLLAELEEAGTLTGEVAEYLTVEGVQPGTEYRALVPFEEDMFSPEELEVLRTVRSELAHLRAKDIATKSHQEKAWMNVPERETIPYALAADLSLD